MGLLVRLQDRRPRERFPAEVAPERSLACVNATVILHVVPQLEGLAAELTFEGPVTRVDGQVSNQGAHIRERLAAELAEDDVGCAGVTRRKSAGEVRRFRRAVVRLIRLM